METLPHNHFCRGKAIRITCSECVSLDLGIQHAMRMRNLSSVACLALHYFSTFLINDTIFEKSVLNIKCLFWFSSLLSETLVILWRIQRVIISNLLKLPCKLPLYYCPILTKLEFCRHNWEKYSNITFHYNLSCVSGVPCGQTGKQTDLESWWSQESLSAIMWTRLKTGNIK
jgi:hypothetical protein